MPKAMDHEQVVYLARTDDAYKVGTTINLLRRMQALRAEPLLVRAGAWNMEGLICDIVAEHRLRGREWFQPTDDARKAIEAAFRLPWLEMVSLGVAARSANRSKRVAA